MSRQLSPLDIAVARAARAAVLATEPSELPLLDDILDPPRQILRWRRPDTVGFGVEDAVHWASPYAVAAALWYGKILFGEGKSVIEARSQAWLRKLLRAKEAEKSAPPIAAGARPTASERRKHVKRVREYAVSLGLDDTRASLLADAIVGSMLQEEADRGSDG